jgi:hypothetical protein
MEIKISLTPDQLFDQVLFACNGDPLLSEKDYPTIEIDEYLKLYQEFLEKNCKSHLAQIMLFSGNYDMLFRYAEMRQALFERIELNAVAYKSFMSDPSSYIPDYKKAKLRDFIKLMLNKDLEDCLPESSEDDESSEDEQKMPGIIYPATKQRFGTIFIIGVIGGGFSLILLISTIAYFAFTHYCIKRKRIATNP